jgi:hypothetical protein
LHAAYECSWTAAASTAQARAHVVLDAPWQQRFHHSQKIFCAMTRRSTYNEVECPHCGERIDTFPDPGGGERQEYIEDCSVCCRPIRFVAEYRSREGEYHVIALPER